MTRDESVPIEDDPFEKPRVEPRRGSLGLAVLGPLLTEWNAISESIRRLTKKDK